MRELAQSRPRYGYRRIHVLLRREGWTINMKRVRRLYRLEGLQLRHRVRRRKHASLHRGVPPAASRVHERWCMDVVHDATMDGRAFRVLTVVDQWSRWSPTLEVAQSMSGAAVAEALERAMARHGRPKSITVDHGTEFTSRALDEWAYRRGVALDFIRPGKTCRKRLHRIIQRQAARVFERPPSQMPGARSKRGESITTSIDRTARWGN